MADEPVPTSERLARVLEARGNPKLARMIALTREGHYDDFRSPLATPIYQLVRDLIQNGEHELAERAKAGEFDATPAEAAAWVQSGEGQAAFREFAGTRLPPSGMIAVETMVAYRDRQPYVVLKWGAESCQMSPADATEHAVSIIGAAQAAVTDAFLLAFLAEKLGLDEKMAAATMSEFRGYRRALEERGHA